MKARAMRAFNVLGGRFAAVCREYVRFISYHFFHGRLDIRKGAAHGMLAPVNGGDMGLITSPGPCGPCMVGVRANYQGVASRNHNGMYMPRIIWLAFLLLMSFHVEAKCDFEYFSHNGYGYTCDYQYESADLIQTLPDGNQSLCRNSVGGGEGNTSYIRTDIEHRDGLYMKQYFCSGKT